MRATLVAVMIATPALLLPGVESSMSELILLVAILAASVTFLEYNSNYPSIVEFRDAPPLNRVRFLALFSMVFLLTVISKHEHSPTNLTAMMYSLGALIGNGVDFPYSPVRLIILVLPDDASAALHQSVRMAAGVAYMISLIAMASFFFIVRVLGWPTTSGAFNVWVNMPLFDPTGCGDVVIRLNRDGRINIILGVLLPFIIPAAIKLSSDLIDPITLENPHTLIWMMSAWAFLPASMIMRGIAMARIADLIEEKRRRAYASAETLQTA